MRSFRYDKVVELLASELQKNGKWDVTVEERSAEGLKPDLILGERYLSYVALVIFQLE